MSKEFTGLRDARQPRGAVAAVLVPGLCPGAVDTARVRADSRVANAFPGGYPHRLKERAEEASEDPAG